MDVVLIPFFTHGLRLLTHRFLTHIIGGSPDLFACDTLLSSLGLNKKIQEKQIELN
jgi:hypothetical protein